MGNSFTQLGKEMKNKWQELKKKKTSVIITQMTDISIWKRYELYDTLKAAVYMVLKLLINSVRMKPTEEINLEWTHFEFLTYYHIKTDNYNVRPKGIVFHTILWARQILAADRQIQACILILAII